MKTTLALLLLIAACTSLSLQQAQGHFQEEGKVTKLNQWQKLTLSVDVAARDGPGGKSSYPLNRAMLQIRWNGAIIEDWRPSDYSIKTLTFKVKPVQGVNTLQFKVPDTVADYGCLDNIKLTSRFISENLIVNGQFENIQFGGDGWNAYDPVNRIPGWRTEKRYAVGPARFFSSQFSTNHVTIDNNHPHMYQIIRFDLVSENEL